jgi:hypothetical protein
VRALPLEEMLIVPLGAVILAGCAAPKQGPVIALDCDALGVEVPSEIPSFDHRRSPMLLNQDTLDAIARSQYPARWYRMTELKVRVRRDGTVSHGCSLGLSADTMFERIALETLGRARFRVPTALAPADEWTTILVVAKPVVEPQTSDEYGGIALTEALDSRFQSKETLAIQAAVLNDFLKRMKADWGAAEPNRAICIGVGMVLPVYDAPEALTALLMPTQLPTFAASACAFDRQRRRLVRKRDGVPAIALWVDIPQIDGDAAEVRAGEYEGPLAAADYRCELSKVNQSWTVDTCVVTATA